MTLTPETVLVTLTYIDAPDRACEVRPRIAAALEKGRELVGPDPAWVPPTRESFADAAQTLRMLRIALDVQAHENVCLSDDEAAALHHLAWLLQQELRHTAAVVAVLMA